MSKKEIIDIEDFGDKLLLHLNHGKTLFNEPRYFYFYLNRNMENIQLKNEYYREKNKYLIFFNKSLFTKINATITDEGLYLGNLEVLTFSNKMAFFPLVVPNKRHLELGNQFELSKDDEGNTSIFFSRC